MQTAANITEANALIRRVDKAVDANHVELLSRCKRKPTTWQTWGRAWDRNPDLHQRERNLFWLRGEFQMQRHRFERERSMKAARTMTRSYRKSACPTCGATSYAA